jgi:hypothetical protein
LPPRGEDEPSPGAREPRQTCADLAPAPSAVAEKARDELVGGDASSAEASAAAAIEALRSVRTMLVAQQLAAPSPPADALAKAVDARTSLPASGSPMSAAPPYPFTILSGGLSEKVVETAEQYLLPGSPQERFRAAAVPPWSRHAVPAAKDQPKRKRRGRSRSQRARRARRLTENHWGHCPARPRWPKQKGTTTLTGQLMALEKANYFVRHTNADPHPALLLRQLEGQVRANREKGLPVWQARKWIRTDLAESQHRFSLFLLQHVDVDSHLVGKPDHKGHIIPYSIAEIVEETGLSRATVNRRISDFVLAGYIFRWQEKLKDFDEETHEEEWVSFVAHMRVNIAFFGALGISEEELAALKKNVQHYRGYKNAPGQSLAERSRKQMAADKFERAQQHGRERRGRGENTGRNVLGGTVIARIASRMTQPKPQSAQEGASRVGIEAQLRQQYPDWDSWNPKERKRVIQRRLYPKPPLPS